jgi:DHA1 family tetracycline resistance protein-like MFS transporter
MLVWSVMALAMPSINAIMSKEVAHDEQGELQGALSSVGGITSAIAPSLLTNVFAFFTAKAAPVYFPGAAFLTAALMLALAALLLTRLKHEHTGAARGAAGNSSEGGQ